MTREPYAQFDTAPIEAGRQVAHLRHLLRIAEEIAGRVPRAAAGDEALDEAARISEAYERSLPVVQRRFDALAEESAGWAAGAVETLLVIACDGAPPHSAAAQLARELDHALRDLARTLR
jgi:hypothetical protein